MSKETLDEISFSLDLVILSAKLDRQDPSEAAPDTFRRVEDALRAAGVRQPVRKTR